MTTLRLDQIEIDHTLQIRQRLDESAIERYADAFDELPPPVVYKIDGAYLLSDGMHRLAAATRIGRDRIGVEIRQGTRADAEEHAITANTKNAIPLTAGERDEGIRRLRERPMGYGLIAKKMSLPEITVQRIVRGQEVKRALSKGNVTLPSRSHYEELARFPEEIQEPVAKAAAAQGWNSVELRKVAKALADPEVGEDAKRRVMADLAQPGTNGEATVDADVVSAVLREARGFSARPQIRAFVGAAHSLLDHLKRDADPLSGMAAQDFHRLAEDVDAAQEAVDKLRALLAAGVVLS